MSDRVAVVAGAGGPVGRAVAVRLAGAGFTVVGVDRNEDGLRELPDGIRQLPGDATDPTVPKALLERIVAEVGVPDVLVNTIGTFAMGDALAATPDELRLMTDVNAGTALWLTQAVVPHMRQRGSGAIVHVSARQATEPVEGVVAYSLSKAALTQLVRVLDVELRPQGIRVNAVAPELIDTPRNRQFLPADLLDHAVTPDALAEVIAFLVSDAAAPVSGAVLPIHGS
ncbi:NAD(P)-dependent dehydrogenase (short-subunit alcohol dehydrogenase family) [Streptacidiphilus sp. MAP12-33]|uniref:SDR family NAD(P)-dependent oxidoreductase n=1 Tax=Streptacidiphilus sp. MAP12-33 TaxID=3156266 RepID=UPI0035191EE7